MAEVLMREFCNHVYLGQWELSRAYAYDIINNDCFSSECKSKLISIIKSLTKDPYIARYVI